MTTLPPSMPHVQAHTNGLKSPLASPMKSPRRVLGDMTPNAQIASRHNQTGAKSPFKTRPIESPLKAQDSLQAAVKLPKNDENELGGFNASKKRPFSAIESPSELDATRSPMKRQHDMKYETVSPAALRSPIPPPVTIELADDDSDTDEEPLAHSTEVDMEHMDLPNATQGTTGSFSSLIDYNPDNASDHSDAATRSPSSSPPVTSRVELLKLRLRMAMYKINTNQTLLPFSKLEQPHKRETPAQETEDHEEDAEELAPHERSHENASEHEIRPANIVITGGPIAKLGNGPIFAPTAFSARFVGTTSSSPRNLMRSRQMTPMGSPTRPYARDERELTSSVVKGHAASGLLELAHSK